MTESPLTAPTTRPTARLAAPPEVLDGDPPVTALMTREIVAIAADARVPTALHMMAERGVRHLPVLDRGQCIGVLVEADLVRALAQNPGRLTAAAGLTVRELRRPSRELPPTARASDAAEQVAVDASDAVLVTDRGRVLGIVTATDLVRLLARAVR